MSWYAGSGNGRLSIHHQLGCQPIELAALLAVAGLVALGREAFVPGVLMLAAACGVVSLVFSGLARRRLHDGLHPVAPAGRMPRMDGTSGLLLLLAVAGCSQGDGVDFAGAAGPS